MQNILTYLLYISIGICLLYLLIQILYLTFLSRLKRQDYIPLETLPHISILVAARNEADNIIECLTALNNLEYDEGKIEILIGNDLSTDYTQMLVENFIEDKSNFKLINLTGKEHPKTKGKARVLATLADQAKGDVYLITDADIQVPKLWAKGMVGMLMNENGSICGGTTNIIAGSNFEKFQQVDWLYFMGIIHTFSSFGKPLTVVGNNMGITREAYEKTGGYGEIPFSITEDYALFKQVQLQGGKVVQKLNMETMVYSKPLDTIKSVLKQRKRWLTGGWDLPIYYHIMIFIFGAWYFALPILFFYNFKLALLILIVKDCLQLFQLLQINKHLNLKVEHPFAVLFYELYLFLMIPLTSIYFLLPTKNTWKGRKY
ncbi:MAG: glycosyltransferase [Bacteroidia bacterium]